MRRETGQAIRRARVFTPRLRIKACDEMNAWLLERRVAYAKAHRHQESIDKTIREAFEEERQTLLPSRGRFDGFHEA
ncbi:MAG: IS21 family transposase, partial [Methylocella sp.]